LSQAAKTYKKQAPPNIECVLGGYSYEKKTARHFIPLSCAGFTRRRIQRTKWAAAQFKDK
jgi:hypothetical protein